jgi:heme A synthase
VEAVAGQVSTLDARAPSAAALDAPRWLRAGFTALAVEVYGLLAFGAAVRVNRAGLSCPDWPLCFGDLVPEMDLAIFLEWGHRALAGTVSVAFLGLGGAVLAHRAARARAGRWVLLAGGVLLVQIVLGGLTVLHLLADWSVTSHLLAGNAFLAMVLCLRAALGEPGAASVSPPRARTLVGAVGAALLVQVALGGLVASNHAGLACADWPACGGGVWFPAWDGIVGLQVIHRLGAYGVLCLTWTVAWALRRDAALRGPAAALAGLVLAQALLGIGNVLFRLPQVLAIGHSAMAGLLTVTWTTLAWRAWAGRWALRGVEPPAPELRRGA